MGTEKYLRKIEELFKRSPVVSFSSIDKYVKNINYSKQIIHNLVKKGKIKRLTKGLYSKQDNPQLAVFCFKPAYFGLQDSLSYRNLWEQETIPVIITTRKVRNGMRKFLGQNVLVRRIDKKYFFGFEYIKDGEFFFPYSDVEKTLIDMVYFNERLDENTLKSLKKNLDTKKLNKYLQNYSVGFKKRVLTKLTE